MEFSEVLVAITSILLIFGGPIFAIYLFLHFSNKNKNKKMDTLVKIVEQGGEVDPQMMGMLNEPVSGPGSDLRKGLIWLAIGIPLTLALALNDGGDDWTSGIFGLIPVFIGVAYLIVMKYGHEKSKTG